MSDRIGYLPFFFGSFKISVETLKISVIDCGDAWWRIYLLLVIFLINQLFNQICSITKEIIVLIRISDRNLQYLFFINIKYSNKLRLKN